MSCYPLTAKQFIVFLICVVQLTRKTNSKSHADIIKELFEDASGVRHIVRPNFPDTINVTVGVYVMSIDNLNLKEMTFDTELLLRQQWIDVRLRHRQRSYVDATALMREIWAPDTYFVQSKKARIHGVTNKNMMLKIFPNGVVHYSARLSVRVSCIVDLHLFPLDIQTCPLSVESFAHDKNELRYTWENDTFLQTTSDTHHLAMYTVAPLLMESSTTEYVLGKWSTLTVTFTFIRKTSIFVPGTYGPCAVIVVISWITFILHPKQFPARTHLNVIAILTIITLQTAIDLALPRVSYVKVIDEYILACILFVSAAFLEYAVVIFVMEKKRKFWMERRRKRRVKKRKQHRKSAILYSRWSSASQDEEQSEHSDDELSDSELLQRYIDKHNRLPSFYLSDRWPIILDEYSRVAFPVLFLMFNILYIYYCSKL